MKPLRQLTIVPLALLALFVFAATPAFADARTDCAGADADAATSSAAALRTSVICLANRERVARGIGALKSESRLTVAAQLHSDDMALKNYFAHVDLSGGQPEDRAKAAGYTTGWVGENIGAGYVSPYEVVLGWMQSSGHCANILSARYTDVGIGIAAKSDSDYGTYWTMVLGGNSTAVPKVTIKCPYSTLTAGTVSTTTPLATGTSPLKAKITLLNRRSGGRFRVEGKVTPVTAGAIVKLTITRGKKSFKYTVKTTKSGSFATTIKAPRGSSAVRVSAKA
jgi:uncharacterized protein YkwD